MRKAHFPFAPALGDEARAVDSARAEPRQRSGLMTRAPALPHVPGPEKSGRKLGVSFWDALGTRLCAPVANPTPNLADVIVTRPQPFPLTMSQSC
jgi:hypothetical protein